jgi:hypothetical protein
MNPGFSKMASACTMSCIAAKRDQCTQRGDANTWFFFVSRAKQTSPGDGVITAGAAAASCWNARMSAGTKAVPCPVHDGFGRAGKRHSELGGKK